jgi:SAM-dependent methyltransferase
VSYAWNAADYARHSAGQQKWALDLLDEIDLAADDVVLDLGCGDGKVTAEIARRLPLGRVLGVDLSADMIRHATEASADRIPISRLGVRRSRATFEGRRWCSNAALHWVRDHRPSSRASAGPRPGGRCVWRRGSATSLRCWRVQAVGRPALALVRGFSTYGFHHRTTTASAGREAGAPSRVG